MERMLRLPDDDMRGEDPDPFRRRPSPAEALLD
jgi:hypothetical protein